MTCPTCTHFQRLTPEGGLCRRHAPRAILVTRFRPDYGGNVPAWPNETATVWPPVQERDYCGDWTPSATVGREGLPSIPPVA